MQKGTRPTCFQEPWVQVILDSTDSRGVTTPLEPASSTKAFWGAERSHDAFPAFRRPSKASRGAPIRLHFQILAENQKWYFKPHPHPLPFLGRGGNSTCASRHYNGHNLHCILSSSLQLWSGESYYPFIFLLKCVMLIIPCPNVFLIWTLPSFLL